MVVGRDIVGRGCHRGSRTTLASEILVCLQHSTALAAGKLIHNLLCDCRVKNDNKKND